MSIPLQHALADEHMTTLLVYCYCLRLAVDQAMIFYGGELLLRYLQCSYGGLLWYYTLLRFILIWVVYVEQSRLSILLLVWVWDRHVGDRVNRQRRPAPYSRNGFFTSFHVGDRVLASGLASF